MTDYLSKDHMIALYAAMRAPPPGDSPISAANVLLEIAKEGWVLDWRVEDLILMTDRRLVPYRHGVDLARIGEALGYKQTSVCHRPRARTGGVSLDSAWSSMDFAGLLISFEMLGFAIDPAPLVNALLPTIPKRGYISNAALDVLWYARHRGKCQISVKREEAAGIPAHPVEHPLRAGYRLHALLDGDGTPLELTVIGPRYRQPRRLVETVCPICGYKWWRGDPDSSANHRREHKKRIAYLDPQPDPRMIAELAQSDDAEHVDWLSPRWKHEEMYRRAFAFKRELRFDFVQWTGSGECDRDANGFLFSTGKGEIVGACAFRLREFEEGPEAHGLQWVWVAPKHRRSGVLRARWSEFRRRFGDFWVEPPVSEAMKSFLISVGDEQLLKLPVQR